MNTYDIGDVIKTTCTFSVDDAATDPTTVTLTVKKPSGTATSYTYAAGDITKSSTGVYSMGIPVTEAGLWWYEWVGTGTAATAEQGNFFVRKRMVTA